jgi:response regulator RpfG family c-di-GMP phosphodiesterase
MIKNIPFFIADEEETTIQTFKKYIPIAYPKSPIYSSDDGLYTWDFIQKYKDLFVVICGINLQSINGLQLLKNVKSHDVLKDTYFIILSNKVDREMNIKMLQSGADNFLNIPFTPDEFLSKVMAGHNSISLHMKIRNLNKDIEGLKLEIGNEASKMKEMLLLFQKIRIPGSEQLLNKVGEAAVWIANEYGVDDVIEIKYIEEASKFALIGKLFLPDKSIDEAVTINGLLKNETMSRIPAFASELLSMVRDTEEIKNLLLHVYENFDGSGFPEKLQSWQIPLGSRIIRVLLDFYDLIEKKNTPTSKAIEILDMQAKRIYDFKIVALMDQFLAANSVKKNRGFEKAVPPRDLMENMVLSRNIYTSTEFKLMSAGTCLNPEQIDKIQTIVQSDPIIGKIYVNID